MDKNLIELIQELAVSLRKFGVEYLFVGGIAVGIYGQYRLSKNLGEGIDYDIDIWYSATNINFSKLVQSLSNINPDLTEDLDKIIFDPTKTSLKFNPGSFHFDFLPRLVAFDHSDFTKCFNNRMVVDLEGVKINFISKADLIHDKTNIWSA